MRAMSSPASMSNVHIEQISVLGTATEHTNGNGAGGGSSDEEAGGEGVGECGARRGECGAGGGAGGGEGGGEGAVSSL